MIQNPFLTIPQVESPASRSWGLGFAFGFQGPAQSTMTPADIQPEDADAFDSGVLAGQNAAIDGIPFNNPCVDLNAEGPSVPHLAVDGTIEGGITLFAVIKHGFALSLLDGVLLVVNLSIALETFTDDPDAALEQEAVALQKALQGMGMNKPMELFIGGAVDTSNLGCELKLTPIFRSQEAATASARALGRPNWLVASWRTDQSGGVTVVAFSGN
ncbi:MAG TPA: hypothetical protein VKG25_20370 [Bryobacteraceae bacterium]|nr:hypothetical protein [Bryobacteraceae bacterium]